MTKTVNKQYKTVHNNAKLTEIVNRGEHLILPRTKRDQDRERVRERKRKVRLSTGDLVNI